MPQRESETGQCRVLGRSRKWQVQPTDHGFLGGDGPGAGEEGLVLTSVTCQG